MRALDDSTIAAVATPPGPGAISIIRLSGPRALSIAAAIFRPPGGGFFASKFFESHRLYYGHVVDPKGDRTLDEVLLSVMRGPRSYTREDVVEINAHGGHHAARAILELVVREGARLSEPGEFTCRAFLNGRIDLTQAEAVCDVIQARSQRSLEASVALLGGGLRLKLLKIQDVINEIRIALEAGIDFPEDVPETVDSAALRRRISEGVVAPLQLLIRNSIDGRTIREGLAVTIMGRPNVGKSSLMNRLLEKDRSIVTDLPGTTRDVVQDSTAIDGVVFHLQDTAGLHRSPDPVESIGMAKTRESAEEADLVILVVEAHRPVGAEEIRIFEMIGSKPRIVVMNKVDLWTGPGDGAALPANWRENRCLSVSALTGAGIEELRAELYRAAVGGIAETAETLIPNLRQKGLMQSSLSAAMAAAEDLSRKAAPELVAVSVGLAANFLGEILGSHARAEILDGIFSRFCIGK
jgi:tRNA modification GTPase